LQYRLIRSQLVSNQLNPTSDIFAIGLWHLKTMFKTVLCWSAMNAFDLMTQTSFYLYWYSISNKDRTIFKSTCVIKWKTSNEVAGLLRTATNQSKKKISYIMHSWLVRRNVAIIPRPRCRLSIIVYIYDSSYHRTNKRWYFL